MSDVSQSYEVRIDSEVDEEISDHAYFLGRVSVSAAERLIGALYDDIDSLAHMPNRNPPYVNDLYPNGEYRYMLSGKRYKIVYEVYVDLRMVHVVHVLDARRRDGALTPYTG